MKHYTKIYILSLILISSMAFAFAAPAPYAHLVNYVDMGKPFLTHIINGNTATYSICVSKEVKAYDEKKMEDIFFYSVNQWFDTTKDFINFTYGGRTDFKDILNILEHRGHIRKVDCDFLDQDQNNKQMPDLIIFITDDISKYCNFGALSCYNSEENVLFFPEKINTSFMYDIVFGKQRLYNNIVTHELGHAFGLADEYPGVISHSSFIYNSGVKRPSIMESGKYITCDDVDGFITSIDRIKHTKRTFKSFCQDGTIIDDGKAVAFTKGKINTVKEFYRDFDAEIVTTYEEDSKVDDNYFLDITLDNFDKSENAVSVLHDMGFYINDETLLSKYRVQIHAHIKERDYPKEHSTQIYRMPQGLVSSILLLDDKEEQVVVWDLLSQESAPVRTIIEQNKVEELDRKIMLPIINYFPPRIRVQDNLLKETEAKINRFAEKSVKSSWDNDIQKH